MKEVGGGNRDKYTLKKEGQWTCTIPVNSPKKRERQKIQSSCVSYNRERVTEEKSQKCYGRKSVEICDNIFIRDCVLVRTVIRLNLGSS